VAVDMQPQLSPACSLADMSFSVPAIRDPDYIGQLLNICLANQVRLVIPTIDTELATLADNRKLFQDKGIEVVVSDSSLINIGRNKRNTHDFFISRNISVAQEYAKNKLAYPFFVKPVAGSSSKDLHFIKDESFLFQNILKNSDLMCLEYLSPEDHDEYTVDCYYSSEGSLKCAVPRLRIETRGGEVSKGCTLKNFLSDFVFETLGFIEGARGCLTWQFFVRKNDKKVYGIELNPRFGGGYPLSYQAGANFPLWLINEYLFGIEVPVFKDWQSNLLMLRYDEDLFFADYKVF